MPKIREGFPFQRLVRRSHEWRKMAFKHPISSLFCITDIGHFPNTHFHWVDRESGTKEHIMIYNRTGMGRAFIGKRSWTVPPQHILVIPKNVPHSYGSDESAPWSIYWLHISGHKAGQLLDLLDVSATRPLLSVRDIKGLLPLFESALEVAANNPSPEDAPLLSEQLLHLVNTLRQSIQQHDRPEPKVDPRIESAMNFMRANLDRSCSLTEIAHAAGLSVPQFSTLFRSHAGTSPLRFFTRWRMQRAAQWLENSKDPINQIAAQIGFEDSFYFCRVFRQYVGVSPRQYRKHIQKRNVPNIAG